jgi:hypothetical protein
MVALALMRKLLAKPKVPTFPPIALAPRALGSMEVDVVLLKIQLRSAEGLSVSALTTKSVD